MAAQTLEIAQRGQLTIPKALREKYHLRTGQKVTLIDLGGVLVINPKASQVNELCDKLRDDLLQAGATLEDMLAELRAMREARA